MEKISPLLTIQLGNETTCSMIHLKVISVFPLSGVYNFSILISSVVMKLATWNVRVLNNSFKMKSVRMRIQEAGLSKNVSLFYFSEGRKGVFVV